MEPAVKAALLVALVLAVAAPATAARWKPVSVTTERSIFIDMDALARNGNVVQAWDWQKFAEPQTSANWQGNYVWVKSLTNYHCMRRTTDPVLKVYFGADGVEVKRANLEGLQFPAAVEPDSLREKLLEMACNPPKPVAKATPEEKAAPKAMTADGEAAKGKADAGKVKPDDKSADKEATKEAVKDKVATKAPVKPTPVAKVDKPRTGYAPVVYKRTYTLPALDAPRKKTAHATKTARPPAKPEALCPPQAAAPKPPAEPSPHLTDAGSDGLFN